MMRRREERGCNSMIKGRGGGKVFAVPPADKKERCTRRGEKGGGLGTSVCEMRGGEAAGQRGGPLLGVPLSSSVRKRKGKPRRNRLLKYSSFSESFWREGNGRRRREGRSLMLQSPVRRSAAYGHRCYFPSTGVRVLRGRIRQPVLKEEEISSRAFLP